MRFDIRLFPSNATVAAKSNVPAADTATSVGTRGDEVDILVSREANAGKVASYLARVLDEGSGAPALRSMGPHAVNQSLKAAIF